MRLPNWLVPERSQLVTELTAKNEALRAEVGRLKERVEELETQNKAAENWIRVTHGPDLAGFPGTITFPKRVLSLLALMLPLVLMAQAPPYIRNFFDTNANPVVQVTAGSNVFVGFTQAGQTRTYKVDVPASTNTTVYGSNVVGAVSQATHATNADNAVNATNLWGVLQSSNLPPGLSSSNFVGNFTGDGSGLTNIDGATSLTSNSWWLATNSPAGFDPTISNSYNGTFTGNGDGLTNLNASQLTSGTVPDAALNLTNRTASGLTLVGPTTNAPQSSPNWVGGLWGTNYPTGNWWNLTNGTLTLGPTNAAATITLNGQNGTFTNTGPVSMSGTQFVGKVRIGGAADTTDALNVTGTIKASGLITGNGFVTASGGFQSGNASMSQGLNDQAMQFGSQLTASPNWKMLTIGPISGTYSAYSTGWPSLYVIQATNTPTLRVIAGTNLTAPSELQAYQISTINTLTPSNGVVQQLKPSFTTNYTLPTTAYPTILVPNGTNQVITLPAGTASLVGIPFHFCPTNPACSFIVTNAAGSIMREMPYTSWTNSGYGLSPVGFVWTGTEWALYTKTRTTLPNAQYSTSTNLTLTTANAAYVISYDTTAKAPSAGSGIALGPNSTNSLSTQIWCTNRGDYLITVSSVFNPAHNADTLHIWLTQNGVNVPNSNTPISPGTASALSTLTVNFIVSVTTPSYFEFYAQANNTGCVVQSEAASGNMPATPSTIVTINRVSDL